MLDLDKIKGFEWDKGNTNKSYQKHGISPNQAEEIFLDENILIRLDIKHSRREKRYSALGKTCENKILFIIFTIRGNKIKIISARQTNKKERRKYEKKTKENS